MTRHPDMTPAQYHAISSTTFSQMMALMHGSHPTPQEAAARPASIRPFSLAAATPPARPFGYICDVQSEVLPESPQTVAALKALGLAMAMETSAIGAGFASINPTGYTYWGQFLDHDLTAATDRTPRFELAKDDIKPFDRNTVIGLLDNERTPAFDLDSVYGHPEGPFQADLPRVVAFYDPADRAKFRIGDLDPELPEGAVIPEPGLGLDRDLPRNIGQAVDPNLPASSAVIGDGRNDENLIIAQFHLTFLKFHNAVVNALRAENAAADPLEIFRLARRETILHHQWLVVNDFLVTLLDRATVDGLLASPPHPFFAQGGGKIMSVEFSTAAYRFGHSMVSSIYDFNINFGTGGMFQQQATFEDIFVFTGRGATIDPRMADKLPAIWVIEWERFFFDRATQTSEMRFARKIDPHLALPLANMINERLIPQRPEDADAIAEAAAQNVSVQAFNQLMVHLAQRNLLRGYLFSLPTGQAAARAFNVPALTQEQLTAGLSADFVSILTTAGFLDSTPLWFYILQESAVLKSGDGLGPVGGEIVGQTFISLLKRDADSYINTSWTPDQGIVRRSGRAFDSIMDFQRFSGVRQ